MNKLQAMKKGRIVFAIYLLGIVPAYLMGRADTESWGFGYTTKDRAYCITLAIIASWCEFAAALINYEMHQIDKTPNVPANW